MMLSHLCQARLWTRPERKAITGAVTNDTPRQLKPWPVLNNTIGGICHTEVLNSKETKTDYFLYSRENASSSVTVPIQANPWNLKENNGNTEENNQVFPVNCSYSQISENPAYGLTPAWTDNAQRRYISDDSSMEMRRASEEQECNIYRNNTESESSSTTKEEDEEIRPEVHHKYSINSNKIEHIKHYLRSSYNNFDFKSKHCRKLEVSEEDFSCNENLEQIRHRNSLRTNEHFTHRKCKKNESVENSAITPHVNICNSFSSSDKIYSHQQFTTSHIAEKKQKPRLDKLQCGSTFLSQTNSPQCRIYELPLYSNNLVTEQESEQTSLWTESHLPSSNLNHRHNTCFNNDWYQLALPKYQKLPLQKNSTPSQFPSQKISQNVSDILQKSSKKSPANISMVIMKCSHLLSHPKENSSVNDIALPMGSLVTALYEESEWLYVQTPHGEKGFVNFANCMALGTLTDEYFALTNGLDNLGSTKDTESSDEESEPEQPVSMKPLQETNYSKLAEVKANYNSGLQQNDMEKILSMITKHGLGQISSFNDENYDREESNILNSKVPQFTDTDINETKNFTYDNIQANCKTKTENLLIIHKNRFTDVDKISCKLECENANSLEDLNIGNAETTKIPEKLTSEHPKSDLPYIKTYFDFVKNEDTNFIKGSTDKLNILDGSERRNEAYHNCKDIDYRLITELPISVNQDKTADDTFNVSSVLNEAENTCASSDENRNSLDNKSEEADLYNLDMHKVQNFEILSNEYGCLNEKVETVPKSTKKEIPNEERTKTEDENDLNCFDSKQYSYLHKNNNVCSADNSKCANAISETEENIIRCKSDNTDNYKAASSVLAVIESYTGKEEGTLSVKKGDLVTLLNIVNSEWIWVSSANGIEGYIPSVCTSQVGIF